MKPFTYLIIDLTCIAIPVIASFYREHPFYREWKYFFPANILVAFVFLVWDYWFTKIGVWGFNPDYLTGIYLLNLPVEEVLFFICIPYSCVFSYFVCKKYMSIGENNRLGQIALYSLLFACVLASFLHFDKLYTFSTAIFLLATLIFVWIKKIDLNLVVISYLFIMPFFFASNGILTGSFLESPIVWYNNSENLAIRMFTIPIEDMFYGFLLILLNVLIYEKIKLALGPSRDLSMDF